MQCGGNGTYEAMCEQMRRYSIDDYTYYAQSACYSQCWNERRAFDCYRAPETAYAHSRARIMSFSEGKKKKGSPVDFIVKYKTEMCKNWEKSGHCEFQAKCAFAHGEHELRQKTHVTPQYKTRKCWSFYETGFCPYGHRCQFLHDENCIMYLLLSP
eukprot:TRINITY_DN14382_c0_g2_i13.p2 TRINITY_DN14382_c0_g2~~TRINITY_DN14382_c0_g2_i13.p2  ORF type:complete len:156 (-),score=29.08 TRINITY_DN14382_c0_g2_i13:472-939(-)